MEFLQEEREVKRCENLRRYQILDTPPERVFDDLTQLASQCCQMPIALVSLLDSERQWFKSRQGIPAEINGSPRELSFCAKTIEALVPFIVEDASVDEHFKTNPWVCGEAHIRFYAGIPLVTQEGYAIGTLCVLDRVPRKLDTLQMRALIDLAHQVMTQIERHYLSLVLAQTEKLVAIQKECLLESASLAALGTMTAGLAHEINNPLTIIQARAVLLSQSARSGAFTAQSIIEACEQISNTVTRISKIIKGMKMVSRKTEETIFFEVSLQAWLEETLSFCNERFKHEGVRLEIILHERDHLIRCNPVELSQAFLNLLNNALDAVVGLSEKWVKINFEEYLSEVCIRITDSGFGIPDEVSKKMFHPFFTTKAVGKGTGLGLSLAKKMIENQNGALIYRKDSSHTTFEVRVPLISSIEPKRDRDPESNH